MNKEPLFDSIKDIGFTNEQDDPSRKEFYLTHAITFTKFKGICKKYNWKIFNFKCIPSERADKPDELFFFQYMGDDYV